MVPTVTELFGTFCNIVIIIPFFGVVSTDYRYYNMVMIWRQKNNQDIRLRGPALVISIRPRTARLRLLHLRAGPQPHRFSCQVK